MVIAGRRPLDSRSVEIVTRLGPFPPSPFQPEQLLEAADNRPRITGTGPMTIHPRYIGCDISKHFIDIHDPVSRSAQRLANTQAAMAAFAAAIAGSGALVVMAASGVYDQIGEASCRAKMWTEG